MIQLNLNDRITFCGMTGRVGGLDRIDGKLWLRLDNGRNIWVKASDVQRV